MREREREREYWLTNRNAILLRCGIKYSDDMSVRKKYKENAYTTINFTTKDLQIQGTMDIIYVNSTK